MYFSLMDALLVSFVWRDGRLDGRLVSIMGSQSVDIGYD
jgi:hypothetical protein